MFKASAITKRISGAIYLQDVSLTCEPGQAICVLGPNGAGKSLLLKALALVDPPTSGSIEVGDRKYAFPETGKVHAPPPWPEVSFVFQQLFLWPHLSLRANMLLAANGAGQTGRDAEVSVARWAERLGVAEMLNRYPNQISGGQRQRVALGRALACRPKWLLLDEPNSALDVEQNQLLRDLLMEQKQQGLGIIFSTHLIGFAAALADKVVFLDQGRLVEQGDAGILANPQSDRLRRFLDMIEFKGVRRT